MGFKSYGPAPNMYHELQKRLKTSKIYVIQKVLFTNRREKGASSLYINFLVCLKLLYFRGYFP